MAGASGVHLLAQVKSDTALRPFQQIQKLFYRGAIDLVSGRKLLKRHRSEASISTNIRIDRT